MIIGLYSPVPQSGKSTVAQHLAQHHGYEILPFAQPLRAMLSPLLLALGLSNGQAAHCLYQDKTATIPGLDCNARYLLQTLGTEWGRRLVDDQVWVKCWAATAQGLPLVVADDVRFLNEAQAVQALGGQVWKVWRPGQDRGTTHASEGSLDAWDGFSRLIANDGNLNQLARDVDFALR